jgi:hypothetical protein
MGEIQKTSNIEHNVPLLQPFRVICYRLFIQRFYTAVSTSQVMWDLMIYGTMITKDESRIVWKEAVMVY